MTTVSIDVAIGQLLAVLQEGFEGPPNPWSYFTDNRPDAGLFGTLGKLDAAEASRALGGSSIVAHVVHLTFALFASSAWIRGDRTSRNWAESWRGSTADDGGWTRVLQELRAAYSDLVQAIQTDAGSSLEAIGGAIGALAHAAYHLGAIRQKVLFIA